MIYLDNAATSFPKPPEVIRAMAGVEEKMGANPGRGGHRLALRAGRVVEHCREEAARLLGVHHPERILFTANCTEALNLAISGTLRRGDEVICSYAEHNAVMRLLDRYVSRGEITVHMLAPDERGILSPASLRRVISRKTALVIIAHASNVTGLIQPIAQLGAVCRERGVPCWWMRRRRPGWRTFRQTCCAQTWWQCRGTKGCWGRRARDCLCWATA